MNKPRRPESDALSVTWLSHNRPPRCASNPAYPNGMDVNISPDVDGCWVDLPFPAEGCGVWLIVCPICDHHVGVTAAGRPDDPRRVRIPCNLKGAA